MKRLTAFAAALVLALGALGLPGAARAEGGDNAAVAVNTKDGSSLFKLAFSIRRVASDVVDQTNAAVAYASCTACQTVAVAIQVVLVTGNPDVVDPTNVALAINYECTLCVTFADAMQFVLSTGGPVHFTAEGNKELAQIRQDLEALRKADLPLDQLIAKLEEIQARIANVLRTQLVPAGKSGGGDDGSGGTSTEPASTQPAQTEPAETQPPPTDTGETSAPTGTQPTTTAEPATTGTTTTGP